MSPAAVPPRLAGVRVPGAQALPAPQGLHCRSQAPAGAVICCQSCSVPRQALPKCRTRLLALVLRVPRPTFPPLPRTCSGVHPQRCPPSGGPPPTPAHLLVPLASCNRAPLHRCPEPHR